MILDENQINAVSGRIELDLRLGASFTRFQTLTLQKMGGGLADLVLSYGQSLSTLIICVGLFNQGHASFQPLVLSSTGTSESSASFPKSSGRSG